MKTIEIEELEGDDILIELEGGLKHGRKNKRNS